MITVPIEQLITTAILEYLIKEFRLKEMPRLIKLGDYYGGKQDILKRTMIDPQKPNNKAVNAYANYITDMFTGYFMGEEVTYTTTSADKALEELKLRFNYNDESDENSEIATDCSVYGKAYEMLYVDTLAATRFKKVDVKEVICIYDNTVEAEMLYAIRFYSATDIMGENAYSVVEVTSKTSTVSYKGSEDFTGFIQTTDTPHYFTMVPFIEYKNNNNMIGDFELVITLIDAYDKLCSDVLNDFEQFTDCYLGLTGVDAEADDIRMMKENRVLLIPAGGTAQFITKNINDAQQENLKTRVEADIHKFSKCANLTDKEFAGTSSGVALKYKLMGMENTASIKERKFKKGLQRRIELIANVMKLNAADFDYRSIEITFTRNIPTNVTEIAEVISKLKDVVSKETLLAQIPFIEDNKAELLLIEGEKVVAQPVPTGVLPIVNGKVDTLSSGTVVPQIA